MKSDTSDNKGIKVKKPVLPKGGGAVQGMGETFTPNAFNGSAGMSVPVPASACRGFEPQLHLNYSSGNGNTPFGFGWEVSVPEISRRTSLKMPTYTNTDTFIYTNGEYLIPRVTTNGVPITYTAQIGNNQYTVHCFLPCRESEFDKIERYMNDADPTDDFWKVTSPENNVSIFGKNAPAKIADPENPTHIFRWLLEESYNDRGDHQIYIYQKENSDNIPSNISEINRDKQTQSYLSSVYYGNFVAITDGSVVTGESKTAFVPDQWHFEIVFDYGVYNIDPNNATPHTIPAGNTWPCRPDPFSSYSMGFEIRTYRLCRNILMFHRFGLLLQDPVLVSALELAYDASETLTQLASAKHTGYRYTAQAVPYETKSIPELCFSYTVFPPQHQGYVPHEFEQLLDSGQQPINQGANAPLYQLIDFYSEGIPGILYQDEQSVLYRSPLKVTDTFIEYNAFTPVNFPITGKISPDHTLADITGRGRLDLALTSPQLAGFWEMKDDYQWSSFIPFQSFPTNYHYPLNKFVDVTGDGTADVVLINENLVEYNASLNKKGFASVAQYYNNIQVPMGKQDDRTEIWFYADILGSGLSQCVCVTQSGVACWPNLGYGKFGKKVVMDNAPDFGDNFDIKRLLWADVNGSGLVDLAYMHPGHIDIYFNQSGNGFSSTPLSITFPAKWDELSQVSFADVKGNGTNCLVFAQTHPQPDLWYYDFDLILNTGGSVSSQKPYLLSSIDNNMGATTSINYASSTKFYLEDKRNGVPWITHLPYPVNVIESVTHHDEISLTSLSTSYYYSHGYYDSHEKEFRGFGRVETTDVESFDQFIPQNGGTLAAYSSPNVYTRTWYHTGAFLEEEPLIEQYKKEFWQKDADALPMDYSYFSYLSGLQPTSTARDACRTFYGAVIRSEVYGLDGSPWQDTPYSVSESEFEVREIQARFSNEYSSFVLHLRQSIAYDYERNAADPRISQQFILSTDFYGHILESCAVNYPRRSANIPAGMDPQTCAQQLLQRISCNINTALNSSEADNYWNVAIPAGQTASGGYLLGINIESEAYELTGLTPDINNFYFSWSSIKKQAEGALSAAGQATLLAWERDYYYNAADQKESPYGTILCPALHHRTELAEFKISTLNSEFSCLSQQQLGNLLTSNTGINGAAGGYISFNSGTAADNYYWNPGDSQSYGDATQFFLPNAFFDAFQYPYIYWGATNNNAALKTIYQYDQYNLHVQTVTDPLNNTLQITAFDYQAMSPQALCDINNNTTSVLFDPLGIVFATSQTGKQQGAATGFSGLTSFVPFTKAEIDAVFSAPAAYLTNPAWMTIASFFYYDLHSWKTKKEPVHFKTILRNDYYVPAPAAGNPLYQLDVVYNDGFGRVAQHKTFYDGNSQWLTSGTVRYDNKGQAVENFEPWFDTSYHYMSKCAGVSELLFYDALGRKVLTRSPEDFYAKTLYGCLGASSPIPSYSGYLNTKLYATIGAVFQPSAWNMLHYDENDSILDSAYMPAAGNNVDPDAWNKAKVFANTPFQSMEDSMGNVVQKGQISVPTPVEQNINYFTFDILGDELTSADQRLHPQQLNNFVLSYNLTKHVVKTVSADAGTKWQLQDVMGNTLFSCDSRNTQQYYSYDALQRFLLLYVTNNNPPGKLAPLAQVTQLAIYGDSLNNGVPYFNNPQLLNLRGEAVVLFDEAGLSLHPSYDINKQSLLAAQWIKSDYQDEASWNTITNTVLAALVSSFQGKYQPSDFTQLTLPAAAANLLDPQVYITSAQIDAAGQAITSTDADGNTNAPQYYSNGWLKGLAVTAGSLVQAADPGAPLPGFSNVQYNEKGQRLSVTYANNTVTTYTYDIYSFELMNIKTVRNGSDIVQDLHYHHDPVGNVTYLNNLAAPTVFFNNQSVDALSSYTFDSLYRLKQATGREHAGMWGNVQTNQNKFNKTFFGNLQLWPQLNNGNALQNYTQSYQYDAGGNLTQLQQIGNTAYTRNNTIAGGSNQITSSSVGASPVVNYSYDNNGNMTSLNGCAYATWNYRNNMQSAVVVERPNNENDAEYYVYDAAGQRVRKVHRLKTLTGWNIKETLYVGGVEIRRSYPESTKAVVKEWHSVKLEDGDGNFCVWRYWIIGTVNPGEKKVQLRYQLNDMLDSGSYELDETAAMITYEEYYPYGGTGIMAGSNETEVKSKHYHYSFKEKDNVTGLYYYGMRYYAPWLGRWTCPDPAGTVDGLNIYVFVNGNAVTHVDVGGMGKVNKATIGVKPPTHQQMHADNQKIGHMAIAEMGGKGDLTITQLTALSSHFMQLTGLNAKQIASHNAHVKNAVDAILDHGNYKKFDEEWHAAWGSQDEHLSTVTVGKLLEGMKQNASNFGFFRSKIYSIAEIISSFRSPTVSTGNSQLMHSTNYSKAFFHKSAVGHGLWDRRRRRAAVKEGLSTTLRGSQRILGMLLKASTFSINSIASPFYGGVTLQSHVTTTEKTIARSRRINLKRQNDHLRSSALKGTIQRRAKTMVNKKRMVAVREDDDQVSDNDDL